MATGDALSDAAENSILALIFNATAWANIAQNNATSPATTLTVALHTADPGEAGNQTTFETAYTGYARVAVNRNSGGWTVTGSSVSPVANIDFGACTAAPGGNITHFSIGTGTSNNMLFKGSLSSAITMAVGTIPRIETGSTLTFD